MHISLRGPGPHLRKCAHTVLEAAAEARRRLREVTLPAMGDGEKEAAPLASASAATATVLRVAICLLSLEVVLFT